MNVTVNFLLLEFIKKVKILLQRKSDVYIVTDIDKKSLEYNKEKIDQEIKEIKLHIRSHTNDMQFNIMLINKHDVVLELL